MRLLRIPTFLLLLSLLFISGCTKSSIESLGETLEKDPLGEEIIKGNESPHEPEDQEGKEEEEVRVHLGSVTAKVNGEDFKNKIYDDLKLYSLEELEPVATIDRAPLTELQGNEDRYAISIRAYDFDSGLKNFRHIALIIIDRNFETVVVGKTYDKVYDILSDGVIAAYAEYIDIIDDADDNNITDDIEEVFVKITAIDHEKLLISGEFNFTGRDYETNDVYTVTDGAFTDLNMVVQEQ